MFQNVGQVATQARIRTEPQQKSSASPPPCGEGLGVGGKSQTAHPFPSRYRRLASS